MTTEPHSSIRAARFIVAISLGCLFSACNLLLTDAEIVDDEESDALCDTYCRTIAESCRDDRQQYGTTEQCKQVCLTLDVGEENDETGNTISCRLHYALEAAENTDLCTAAGPGGDGVCGSNCEGFCQIQDTVCVDENTVFPTITDCIGACNGFDDTVPVSSKVVDGDTLACRITHLTLATASPDVHCAHIVPDSPVCK